MARVRIRKREERGERLLTAEEVAARWGVKAKHVRGLRTAGRLPGVRVGTRALRFRLADVEAFERAQRDHV